MTGPHMPRIFRYRFYGHERFGVWFPPRGDRKPFACTEVGGIIPGDVGLVAGRFHDDGFAWVDRPADPHRADLASTILTTDDDAAEDVPFVPGPIDRGDDLDRIALTLQAIIDEIATWQATREGRTP
jgi:hypothetical protein